jgi:hypothetical protein
MSKKFCFRAALRSVLASGLLLTLIGAGQASAADTTFKLFVNPPFRTCLTKPGQIAKVSAKVIPGAQNDTMLLQLVGFKPNLKFDLFTVERSNQLADGTPAPGFTSFGLAWYQSDIVIDRTGKGTVVIKTILLNQIFGFDADVGLPPRNTFHVGFWFNRPADAAACGFTGTTPFNGDHNAGPLAFITRPEPVTGLGPLCTKAVGGVCQP